MSRAGRRTLLVWASVIPLGLVGCGSGAKSSSICQVRAQRLVADTVGLSPGRVSEVASTGNNGMPQCSFKAHLSSGGRFQVTVNVDTSPQPYAVLSRTIVEKQQVFSPTRLVPAPIAVLHLGLLASWFPDNRQLMSTDGVRLVTTTVVWPRVKQGPEVSLATRISRLYLVRSKAALAKLFP